jgi:hypothetical protein
MLVENIMKMSDLNYSLYPNEKISRSTALGCSAMLGAFIP